jgi:hypothetical protein
MCKTYTTSRSSACSICLKEMKHFEQTLATYLWNTCNIYNIWINFCNIQMKHLKYTSKTLETYSLHFPKQSCYGHRHPMGSSDRMPAQLGKSRGQALCTHRGHYPFLLCYQVPTSWVGFVSHIIVLQLPMQLIHKKRHRRLLSLTYQPYFFSEGTVLTDWLSFVVGPLIMAGRELVGKEKSVLRGL